MRTSPVRSEQSPDQRTALRAVAMVTFIGSGAANTARACDIRGNNKASTTAAPAPFSGVAPLYARRHLEAAAGWFPRHVTGESGWRGGACAVLCPALRRVGGGAALGGGETSVCVYGCAAALWGSSVFVPERRALACFCYLSISNLTQPVAHRRPRCIQ